MLPIENFPATTTIPGANGTYDCTVVGLIRKDDGFEFVVVIEDDNERWPATRDFVTAPDGEKSRPG